MIASDLERPIRAAVFNHDHFRFVRLVGEKGTDFFKRYRQAVRGFLDCVLARLTVLEEKTSAAGVRKRKRFTQIRIVDQKLERLVADLLASQHRQLDILGRINEIVGLLVDLLT